jgi:cytochrome P450
MLADPYARYARLRGPVSWNEQMGLWLLTRYDDIRWALGDPRLSSTMPPPAADFGNGSSDLLADMYNFVKSSLFSLTRRTTRGCDGWSSRPSFLL